MLSYIFICFFISFTYSSPQVSSLFTRLNPNQRYYKPKEITLESLSLNEDDIITTSRPIDIDSELSSISRKTYKDSPKPESVRLTHDLASEIERLRNISFEEMIKPTPEPELNYKDGIHIKKPLSEPDSNLKRIDDYLIIYRNPFVYLPTIALYLLSFPSFSYFLVHGRETSRYSIRGITAFATYFLTYNMFKSVYVVAVVLSILVSFLSYRFVKIGLWKTFSIALKPLKYLKIGPRSIRKEPMGWIFVILFTCAVFSNLVYKVLHIVVQLLVGNMSLPRFVRAILPVFYFLFILTLSAVVLAMLVLVVPTRYAQNSVFSLSCSYILFSSVSYLNDFIVYNFSTRLKPIQFDLTQFFETNVMVSIVQVLMILGTLLLSFGTTFLNRPKQIN